MELQYSPLEVQKFLRTEGNTLQKLSRTYNIQCNICPELNLVALNYSNLSNKNDPVVKDCRGLFLELGKNWDVACKSFSYFPEHSEEISNDLLNSIDWESANLIEKLDGALVCIYFYKDKWNIGMRMSTNGSMQVTSINGIPTVYSFAELTKITLKEMNYTWEQFCDLLDKNIYYSFELCSPETRVGVIYTDKTLKLIGAYDSRTLKEIDIYNEQCLPSIFYSDIIKVNNIDEINKIVSENSDPLESEGFILVDKNFNRIKYKNPEYITMMSAPTYTSELEQLEAFLQVVMAFTST